MFLQLHSDAAITPDTARREIWQSRFFNAAPGAGVFLLAAALAYLAYATSWTEIPFPHRYLASDDLIYLAFAKNFVQTWSLYDYPRLAAPFEFSAHDFPFFTYANFIVIAVLDLFLGTIWHSVLFFHLACVGASALFLWLFLARLEIAPPIRLVAAVAYGLTPFVMIRNVGHLDYAVGVLFPLLLLLVDSALRLDRGGGNRRRHFIAAAALGVLATLQQFYFAFYIILFCLALVVLYTWPKRLHQTSLTLGALIGGIVFTFAIVFLLFQYASYLETGRNYTYTGRSLRNVWHYSVSPAHLLLPTDFHRWSWLGKMRAEFHDLATDKSKLLDVFAHSLGAFGAIGLVYLCIRLATPVRAAAPFPQTRASVGEARLEQLVLLGLLMFTSLLYVVPGGISALIGYFVSPQFHGTHRIVVPMACFAAAGGAILLQSLAERGSVAATARGWALPWWTGWALGALGVLIVYGDQTNDHRKRNWYYPDNLTAPARMHSDKLYFAEVERRLPAGAAVYQFPYSTWSGLQPWENVQMKPFIQTEKIVWSGQGMYGRQSHQWGIELALMDFDAQIARLTEKGFSAVLINTKIYETAREKTILKYQLPLAEFEAKLAALTSEPPLVSADGVYKVFMLPGARTAKLVANCERYDLGTRIDLTSAARNMRYLDIGWSTPPTPQGVWMSTYYADRALMRLCIKDRLAADLALDVDFHPNLNFPDERFSLTVMANGAAVGTFDYAFPADVGEKKLAVKIPAGVAARRPTLDLMFRFTRTSPSGQGDTKVGARIRAITVGASGRG